MRKENSKNSKKQKLNLIVFTGAYLKDMPFKAITEG